MGLDVYVSGSTMSHQIDQEKYFNKRLYNKDRYNRFHIDLPKASRLSGMFREYGIEFDEDCFYVKKDDVLKLMNQELQLNPFDYNKDSYDTRAYYLLMFYLEENRGIIESNSKDEFVLIFELSY